MFEALRRRKEQVLEEIRSIVRMRRGKLSTQYFTRSNSKGERVKQGPYFLLQGWLRGKHVSERIPEDEVTRVRDDINGFERFKMLSDEFAELTEQLTRKADAAYSKKKPKRYRKGVIEKPKHSLM